MSTENLLFLLSGVSFAAFVLALYFSRTRTHAVIWFVGLALYLTQVIQFIAVFYGIH